MERLGREEAAVGSIERLADFLPTAFFAAAGALLPAFGGMVPGRSYEPGAALRT